MNPSYSLTRFDGGLNDEPNVLSLKGNQLAVADNWVVNKMSLDRRPGYSRRITTAITGAGKVTGLAYFRDVDFANTFVAVSGGKLWEDVSGTWTERSTGTPFDATVLATLVPVNRSIAITDQTGSPRIWNGSGTVDVLNSRFTRCGCMAEHKGFLFIGDPTDGGTRYYYQVFNSVAPESPTVFADSKSDTNRTDQVICLIPTDDYVLIFLDTQVWYAVYSPTSPSFGQSGFLFAYKVADPGVGIVGPRAAVNVPGRFTAFWGIRGPYIIRSPEYPARYIGERIETFVSGIDKNNQGSIVAAYWPNINSVIFDVPYGTSQTTNNYAVCYNLERDAFTIFPGSSAKRFAFASAVTIKDSDGTNQLFMGNYAGHVMKMGGATNDDGEGFDAEMWTGYLGSPDAQKLWKRLSVRMDLGSRKQLTAKARFYGANTEQSQPMVGGSAGDPFGTFIFGVSAFTGQSLGQLAGDIYGDPSEYIQIGIIHSQNEAARLHGLTAHFERTEQWGKSAA